MYNRRFGIAGTQQRGEVMRKNKELKNLSEFKIEPYILYGFVIYEKPEDFPENCIGRIWNMNEAKATEFYIKRNSVEEVRKEVEESIIFNVCIPRSKEDAESIVETWI